MTLRPVHPLICLLVLSLVSPSLSYATKAKSRNKNQYHSVSARAAILSDSTHGKRYYGKNVNTKILPASTVKVMTALLVLEKLPLDKMVTVRKSATFVQPSKIDVKPGESYKVAELLYALLMSSANDASIVLAEAVAGSEREFVKMMNKRARQLGANNTLFANSNGLPTKRGTQYSTAYDMYLIFRQAIKNDFFKAAIKYQYKTISSLEDRKINLKSHNKLLFQDWGKNIYGKTGYTRAAQACFIGYIQKGENTYIIAVFGCSKRWNDIKHILTKYGGISL